MFPGLYVTRQRKLASAALRVIPLANEGLQNGRNAEQTERNIHLNHDDRDFSFAAHDGDLWNENALCFSPASFSVPLFCRP